MNPTPLAPLLACHLIALDKCPGVHPIGIGDTARRIISIVSSDIQGVTGTQQLGGGQISGVEAAIHATRSSFKSEESEAILLVDTTNALNRQVALQNIRHLCPTIATNTSQEGTTQGDPLAMPMYAIPLIRRLGACK